MALQATQARDDSIVTRRNIAVDVEVTANDDDGPGRGLVIVGFTQPERGVASPSGALTLRYAPVPDFTGEDHFTYTVQDADGTNSSAAVTVTVRPATDAVDDAVETRQDVPVAISALANDGDGSGLGLVITAFTQPQRGAVAIDAGQILTYTPRLHTSGRDSFSYTITDGDGESDTAVVTVTVEPVTLAVDDAFTLFEDQRLVIDVLANDTDGSTRGIVVTSVQRADHGTVELGTDSKVTYTPDLDFSGSDGFEYTITDADGVTASGAVRLNVEPVNDAPTVALFVEPATVSRGGMFEIEVIADDPDSVATVTLLADRDGDPASTGDQRRLGEPILEQNGLTQTVLAEIGGIPLGAYSILAVAADGDAPPVQTLAPAVVTFADVAAARGAGGRSHDGGAAVAALADGGWIACGFFSGSATFGRGEPQEVTLDSAGERDVFVARYAAGGELEWAKRAGGEAADEALGAAAFPDGSCAVAGAFSGTAFFGAGEERETALRALSGRDVFVARFDAAGALSWARMAGGADLTDGGDQATAVQAFADGSCIVAGHFEEELRFHAGEPRESVLQSAGRTDAFIARLSAAGALIWSRRAGGVGADEARGAASLADGSTSIVGSFFDVATFGAGQAAETALHSEGGADVFVARYTPDGDLVWARRAGGGAQEEGLGVAAFRDGSCAITGEIFGAAVFGAGEPRETELRPVEAPGIFVARFAQDGALEWARQAGGIVDGSGHRGRACAALADGSVVVAGSFESEAVFGEGEASETRLEAAGVSAIFAARYDERGRLLWATSAGGRDLGDGGDFAAGIAAFRDGSFVLTGAIDAECLFGEDGGPGALLVSGEAPDAFTAKLNADGGF